jgi:hypothetical protein
LPQPGLPRNRARFAAVAPSKAAQLIEKFMASQYFNRRFLLNNTHWGLVRVVFFGFFSS